MNNIRRYRLENMFDDIFYDERKFCVYGAI